MKIPVLFLIAFLLFVPHTYAHVLKTDGSIGAVIHIDPEDDPIVGVPSNIYFEFKDKKNAFDIDNCECTFVVQKNGTEVHREVLSTETAVFTFSEKNIYSVKVEGTSQDRSFEPFTLTYDLRVSREGSTPAVTTPMLSIPVIIGIGILTIGVLFAIIRQELQRRKK